MYTKDLDVTPQEERSSDLVVSRISMIMMQVYVERHLMTTSGKSTLVRMPGDEEYT